MERKCRVVAAGAGRVPHKIMIPAGITGVTSRHASRATPSTDTDAFEVGSIRTPPEAKKNAAQLGGHDRTPTYR